MIKLTDILNELVEEKADRCLRIARRKYDKPSAYRSGAIVKCRQGKIWKGVKEDTDTVTETYNQSAIKQVFKSNPELADIGTPQQYSEYLSTIFPSSKIKDIVYHASPNKIEKFRDTMFGTYFSYSPIEGTYGGIINSALLNVKNPLVKPEPTDSTEEKVIYDKEYRNYNNPSSLYDASIEGSTVTKEGVQIRVKSPEQIHTLGSKQDIEGFKKYVEKKIVEQLVKGTIQEETLQYSKPNFEYEWEEAIRYPEFKEMGKEGWINLASQGRAVRYSDIKQVLGNVDLNFDSLDSDKKARFEKAFNSGTIELPIAVKFSDNDYDLVAGNTRVAGLVARGIDPKIWVVDLSKKETPKNRVLDALDQRLGRTLQGTAENRLIKKIVKDVIALDGEELKQYLKSNFLNTKNSWKARIIYNSLYDAFEGIKK